MCELTLVINNMSPNLIEIIPSHRFIGAISKSLAI